MKRPVACGLYVLEALAMGVPVVEPAIGAFPELLEMTGGGVLCGPAGRPAEGRFDQTRLRRAAPDQTRLRRAEALAAAMKPLLLEPDYARQLGKQGRSKPAFGGVFEKFNFEQTAEEMVRIYKVIVQQFHRG